MTKRFLITLLVVALSLSAAQGATSVESLGMTVSDMDRAVELYSALTFRKISDIEVLGEEFEHLEGVFGARMRIVQARDEAPDELAGQLWDLPSWARIGHRLLAEMSDATDVPARFVVAAAIVRHLLTDPVLPAELLPADWPGAGLRAAYNDFAAELIERRDGIRLVEAT